MRPHPIAWVDPGAHADPTAGSRHVLSTGVPGLSV